MEVVRVLGELGVNLNHKMTISGADEPEQPISEVSPVVFAYFQGHMEVVKVLVELGAELNAAINDFGLTLVYYASAQGDAENVRLLCEHGADVNVAGAVFFRGGVAVWLVSDFRGR